MSVQIRRYHETADGSAEHIPEVIYTISSQLFDTFDICIYVFSWQLSNVMCLAHNSVLFASS
jgi:hypothetical protein